MLIANSSMIHHMQIFSSAQTYLSGAVSSQWWGKERNPPSLQLSTESPDASTVPSTTIGKCCFLKPVKLTANFVITLSITTALACDGGKLLSQPLRCCRSKMLRVSGNTETSLL